MGMIIIGVFVDSIVMKPFERLRNSRHVRRKPVIRSKSESLTVSSDAPTVY